MPKEKFDKIIRSVGDLFGVLSHPDRIKILGLLVKKETDVNDIHVELQISQSRVSQHLKILKLHSLVIERRDGKHVYYSVKDSRVSRIVESALQFQMLGYSTDPEIFHLLQDLHTFWHI